MAIEMTEQMLLALLSPNGATSIKEIARRLYVSEPTARRYVNRLAQKGMVIRTHGGCMLGSQAMDQNAPMYIRYASECEDKRRIAERAADLIPSSATVFLDSSSTVFQMLPFLRTKQDLTVVTSSIKTAMALCEMNIKTMCLGGFICNRNLSANSAFAIHAVGQVNADLFFFSCDALSEAGEMTDHSHEECMLRKEMMRYARVRVLMVDSTKRNKLCKYNLGTLEDVDYCLSAEDGKAVFLKEK